MLTGRMISGEAGVASGQSSVVPWWSFTKTVLAAAVLALVEHRRLDLDAPVAGASYNLRHLLQHTSGLPDYGSLPEYQAAVTAGESPWPRKELLGRVRSEKLLFEPGSSRSYSNIGYLFVRQIIERATGLELNEALRRLLFEPLDIEEAFVATAVCDLERTIWSNKRQYDPGWVYHGLIVGSPFAAASFLHRLPFGPFLAPHLKTELLNPVSLGGPFPGRPFIVPSYGLGLMLDSKNPLGLVVGHTGHGPGSTAAIYSFPDLRVPRTLAAFMPDDSDEAPGVLETYLQTIASENGRRVLAD